MASFIQTPPSSFLDPSTTIATQIYLWLINPDESFAEKAFGSILILLIIVGSINLMASFVRYRVMKKTTMR
jgi:phosphate transport system permease protein